MIVINKKSTNNALHYLPRAKSNFELISNLNYDVKEILYNGCQYLPNLLCDKNDLTLFNKLLEFITEDKLVDWSKHHKIDNPTDNQIFNDIIKCLADHFNVNILASRLNYYTATDYKPFHHDSHAYSNGIKEDITIGLSLGASRNLAFKHVESGNYFNFPQNNGDVFCFDHLTNQKFMHSIPRQKSELLNIDSQIRISIIIWGKILNKSF
jgi:hypothetical protein